MQLTRIIHPIGQGGFYTETFVDDNGKEVFNVIYDCGSETQKPTLIKTYLKGWIDANPQRKIDAVFISHLHDDHINGLDDLLSTCSVKYLFLPQLTPEVVIESYLYNYTNTGSISNKSNSFITKTLLKEYKNTKIIYVDEMSGDDNEGIEHVHINEVTQESYPSGTVYFNIFHARGNTIKWMYIPFNSPTSSDKGNIADDIFFASVKGKLQDVPQKLKELIKNKGIEECKAIYDAYYGRRGHNSYSMTLFSGIENPSSIKTDYFAHYTNLNCYCFDRAYYPIERVCLPNFLYTGDFEPNRRKIRKSYVELMKEYLDRLSLWETIRRIQVPHHGSRYNFNNALYEYACKGYISAGSKNVHGHPNADTLVNIQYEGCIPVVVNEDPKSMQKEVYLF